MHFFSELELSGSVPGRGMIFASVTEDRGTKPDSLSSPCACWAMGAASHCSTAPEPRDAPCPPCPRVPVGQFCRGVTAERQGSPLLHLCASSVQRLRASKQNKIKKKKNTLWIILNFLHFLCILNCYQGSQAGWLGRCLEKAREPAHPLEGLSGLRLLNCWSWLQKLPRVCRKEHLFTQKRCIA